jgi:hypothetical protein
MVPFEPECLLVTVSLSRTDLSLSTDSGHPLRRPQPVAQASDLPGSATWKSTCGVLYLGRVDGFGEAGTLAWRRA